MGFCEENLYGDVYLARITSIIISKILGKYMRGTNLHVIQIEKLQAPGVRMARVNKRLNHSEISYETKINNMKGNNFKYSIS